MQKNYECKVQIIGPHGQDDTQIKVLNRVVRWRGRTEGPLIAYEVDPSHVEIIVQELGLEAAKFLATFVVKIEVDDGSHLARVSSDKV